MTIHIEICKSNIRDKWYKDKWNVRIGDITGSTEFSNYTIEEILEVIEKEIRSRE